MQGSISASHDRNVGTIYLGLFHQTHSAVIMQLPGCTKQVHNRYWQEERCKQLKAPQFSTGTNLCRPTATSSLINSSFSPFHLHLSQLFSDPECFSVTQQPSYSSSSYMQLTDESLTLCPEFYNAYLNNPN